MDVFNGGLILEVSPRSRFKKTLVYTDAEMTALYRPRVFF